MIKLSHYVQKLGADGKAQDQIDGMITTIRKQRVANIFYLPACPAITEESFILMDDIHAHPLSDFLTRDRSPIFKLNQFFFYYFIIKLSIHSVASKKTFIGFRPLDILPLLPLSEEVHACSLPRTGRWILACDRPATRLESGAELPPRAVCPSPGIAHGSRSYFKRGGTTQNRAPSFRENSPSWITQSHYWHRYYYTKKAIAIADNSSGIRQTVAVRLDPRNFLITIASSFVLVALEENPTRCSVIHKTWKMMGQRKGEGVEDFFGTVSTYDQPGVFVPLTM